MIPEPPRLALSLLRRYVPEDDPLVGDILEVYAARPSRVWFWRQALGALVRSLRKRDGEIRPLRLVEEQPLEAIERTLQVHRRYRDISPTPNPLPASLGLVLLAGLITAVAPILWALLFLSLIAALGLAWLLVRMHQRPGAGRWARRLT
jgi:Flp pilus assembly protein TadB